MPYSGGYFSPVIIGDPWCGLVTAPPRESPLKTSVGTVGVPCRADACCSRVRLVSDSTPSTVFISSRLAVGGVRGLEYFPVFLAGAIPLLPEDGSSTPPSLADLLITDWAVSACTEASEGCGLLGETPVVFACSPPLSTGATEIRGPWLERPESSTPLRHHSQELPESARSLATQERSHVHRSRC